MLLRPGDLISYQETKLIVRAIHDDRVFVMNAETHARFWISRYCRIELIATFRVEGKKLRELDRKLKE